ncbi:hypothetical protein CXB51_007822 [Gossypium anomalum]|uniref:Reverse transcriptase zinc-binding domain-containing protein n=1 Tax=Gossypium anomalum TaxID=47600 RepID=A0A8J5ZEG8_9ROSI|nr:hypothetical protein CXB51_007822 [Gossypium anomalum]
MSYFWSLRQIAFLAFLSLVRMVMIWWSEKAIQLVVTSFVPMQQLSIPFSLSNLLSSRDLFTRIWKIWVPPKVHMIVWRFLCNYVPTLRIIYNRHISTTQYCPRCLNIPEIPIHVLREYPFAILHSSLQQFGHYGGRNRYYHEGLGSTSLKLVSFIRSYLGDLLVLDMPGAVSVVLRTARWCPPPAHLVKANFNTTYKEGSHFSCSEVVVSSAFAAKALALLSVLDLARNLGLSRVMFERDSLHVIRKLNNAQADRSEIRALITKGRLRLRTFSASASAFKSRIGLLTNSRCWDFAANRTVSRSRRFLFRWQARWLRKEGRPLICLNFAAILGLEKLHLFTSPCCNCFFSIVVHASS